MNHTPFVSLSSLPLMSLMPQSLYCIYLVKTNVGYESSMKKAGLNGLSLVRIIIHIASYLISIAGIYKGVSLKLPHQLSRYL